MRSLFVTFCYGAFLAVGSVAPFVFTLGYLWVDSFIPQGIAYTLIDQLPVSQIMGIAAIGGYLVLDRQSPPRLPATGILMLLFAAWVTISTFGWAVVPGSAMVKWNVVIKTLLFSVFIPLAIRSRVQIEAFLQIWLFGFAINFLPVGLKTLISGASYGRDLGIHAAHCCFALSADSRLAMIALMLVPIALYLARYTIILPRIWLVRAMYLAIIVLAGGAAYGTYERTAVIVAALLAGMLWLRAKRKLLAAGAAIIFVVVALQHMPASWLDRMATIGEYHEDNSAMHRIDVWIWMWNYVNEHPLGGGFNIYETDNLGVNPDGTKAGLAYHNDFVEVFGEQGWPGLLLFVGIIGASVTQLRVAARRARRFAHLDWIPELAVTLQMALALQLAGGMFVALGYHPPLYMIFALSTAVREYVRRVENASALQPSRGDELSAGAPLAVSRDGFGRRAIP